jgi:hypothetical protein
MMLRYENAQPQASAIGPRPKRVLDRQLGLSEE